MIFQKQHSGEEFGLSPTSPSRTYAGEQKEKRGDNDRSGRSSAERVVWTPQRFCRARECEFDLIRGRELREGFQGGVSFPRILLCIIFSAMQSCWCNHHLPSRSARNSNNLTASPVPWLSPRKQCCVLGRVPLVSRSTIMLQCLFKQTVGTH